MKQKRGGKKRKEKTSTRIELHPLGARPPATVNNEILGLEQAGQR
jgi:hypothetical protein